MEFLNLPCAKGANGQEGWFSPPVTPRWLGELEKRLPEALDLDFAHSRVASMRAHGWLVALRENCCGATATGVWTATMDRRGVPGGQLARSVP